MSSALVAGITSSHLAFSGTRGGENLNFFV